MRNVAGKIDDSCQCSLRHETHAVADDRNIHTVARQQGMGRIAEGWTGCGCHHQGPVAVKAGQHIDADRPCRVAASQFTSGCRVIAIRSKQAKCFGRRQRAGFHRGAERTQQRIKLLLILIAIRTDPDGRHDIHRRNGLRNRRRNHFSVFITVEALPHLTPDITTFEHLARQGGRAITRLLIKLVVDRFHHRMRNIKAGQIEQFQRPHAETCRFAKYPVDIATRRDAFTENLERLRAIGPARVIDDETRHILGAYAVMAHALRQHQQGIAHSRIGGQSIDHFHHFHQRHRIEEMEPGNPLGVAADTSNTGD